MKSLFKDEAAKHTIAAWFERFRARLSVPTESRVVATRFGDTHVLIGGPVSAPPVVVLHGALASSAHALVELAPLLEQFRVYAVDVIGQSVKSAEAELSVANDDHGRWLGDVLDQLGLSCAHIVGVSWGGFVAIRLAACAPERIDRLALLVPAGVVNGRAWPGFTRLALPMLLYRRWPSPHRRDRFLRSLLTTPDEAWTAYLGDAFRLYHLRMKVPRLATPSELAGFARPTLVIGAEHDVSIPGAALIARARQLFPRLAATELIAGARHCPPTTDDFRRWLGDRLARFLLASEPGALPHRPDAAA
ncbi:MAG TPA: alpha/beta fold hydrolase [Kofleriaceae bacterium]|nr:alpha/beta fold hydrolase [Kofleriaceae bacterium]